jgi:hypothetical protein
MAEELPDAPWATESLPDAPWAIKERGVLERAGEAAWETGKAGVEALGKMFVPPTKEEAAAHLGPSGAWRSFKETGAGLLGLTTPITAPMAGVESIAASGLGAAQRGLEKGIAKGVGAVSPEAQQKLEANIPSSEEAYETARPYAGAALSAIQPARRTVPAPAMPPAPNKGPLDVTLSEGQLTGALPAIKREQAALRAQAGSPEYEHAQAFKTQQTGQIEAAKDKLMADLDTFGGQIIAKTPQEAGELVTGRAGSLEEPASGVIGARNLAKSQVDAAYTQARGMPGEIRADAFVEMPQQIRNSLTSREMPIVVSERTTPAAADMMEYLDGKVGALRVPNKASPGAVDLAGEPLSTSGVNLNGVDRWRRELSSFRRSAATDEDRRATSSIMDAFDSHIDAAVKGGKFTGSPDAIEAWNAARAAHHDYRSTFSQGVKDPVGRVVEKILGRGLEDPATPNDVMNFITGSSGLPANSRNVAVTKRLREILGPDSPEWAGVKQGVFSKLVEKPADMTDFGPGVIANRLGEFLNGKGSALANQLYAPPEKQLLKSYLDLMRKLEMPQAGAQWSNNDVSAIVSATERVINYIGTAVGAGIGHTIGGGEIVGGAIGYATAQAGKSIRQFANTRRLAKQMPLIAIQTKKWQRAAAAANRASPAGAAVLTKATQDLGASLSNLLPAGTARAEENKKASRIR